MKNESKPKSRWAAHGRLGKGISKTLTDERRQELRWQDRLAKIKAEIKRLKADCKQCQKDRSGDK